MIQRFGGAEFLRRRHRSQHFLRFGLHHGIRLKLFRRGTPGIAAGIKIRVREVSMVVLTDILSRPDWQTFIALPQDTPVPTVPACVNVGSLPGKKGGASE